MDATVEAREERAFDNMILAIDMQEALEYASFKGHKSFMLHGAVYKHTRDILEIGDVWMASATKVEMQNADTKRTAIKGGSRRLELSSSGSTFTPTGRGREGPANLIKTKGYSTTMALSTLRKLIAKRYLQRGDGIISMPACRRRERLFGAAATGRTSRKSLGVKQEKWLTAMLEAAEYRVEDDSCVKAFVRLIAASAATQDAAEGEAA